MRLTRHTAVTTRQVFWAALSSSFALLLLWSLATPLLGVPDEPSHIIRAAAVVRGDWIGSVGKDPSYATVVVPKYIANLNSEACFAFRPTTTANCPEPNIKHPDQLVAGVTTSTLNTPVYYFFTGLPSLITNGPLTIYLMRALSSLICALMIAFSAVALSQLAKSTFALTALAVSTTPVLLFLGGSVNPNGVEVCAALAVLSCLLALGRRQAEAPLIHRQQLVMLITSTFFLVNSRSLALAWLFFAVVIAILFSAKGAIRRLFSKRATWIAFAVMSIVVIAAVAWYLLPKGIVQNAAVAVGEDVAPSDAFWFMVVHVFDYAAGWVGIFGWLDIAAPPITFAIWGALTAVAIAAALVSGTWAKRIALLILIAAIVLLPAIAQAALISNWGYVWQGRYHLAIFAMLLVAAGVAIDSGQKDFSHQLWTPWLIAGVIGATAIGHIAAFVVVLRRYAVGTNFPPIFMLTDPRWQPPLGLVGLVIVFAVTLAVVGWLTWRAITSRVLFDTSTGSRSPINRP